MLLKKDGLVSVFPLVGRFHILYVGILLGHIGVECSRDRGGLSWVIIQWFAFLALTDLLFQMLRRSWTLWVPLRSSASISSIRSPNHHLLSSWFTFSFSTACSTVSAPKRNTSEHYTFTGSTSFHWTFPSPLYRKYGLGTTTFSSLDSGILTGKVVHQFHCRKERIFINLYPVQRRHSRKLSLRRSQLLLQTNNRRSPTTRRSRENQESQGAYQARSRWCVR